MPNGEHSGEPDEFENRTFLGIRTHASDNLSEPLPSRFKFWVSPDIRIIQPNGSRASKAIAGGENEVEVVVTNKGGVQAVDAKVDAFVADPSTAFTPATATKIGTKYATINAHQRKPLRFGWTPSPSQAGHRCLLSRVGLFAPPDTYQNPNKFEVRQDRHVAQKNIHVITVSEPMMAQFGFGVVNPLPETTTFNLRARQIRDPQQLDAIRASFDCAFARFGDTELQNVTVELGGDQLLPDALEDALDPEHLPRDPIRLEDIGELMDADLHELAGDLSVTLEPGEVRQTTLQVDLSPEAQPGELFAVDVTQTDEDERPVGGIVLLVAVESDNPK